jgi:hypothetical protein
LSEHEGSSERWYDTRHEMEQFYSALWTVTAIFRKANRPTRFSIDRRLLWRFIEKNGGLHDHGTWLRIESVLPGRDYVVIKQRQSDGTDKIFNLTAVETLELIGSLG